MKHKITFFEGEDVRSQVENFCEQKGFNNIISIEHSADEMGVSVMVHYQSEN